MILNHKGSLSIMNTVYHLRENIKGSYVCILHFNKTKSFLNNFLVYN